MFKIISTNPVIPPSLIMAEVKVPAKRDYIGHGGFGDVFKGEIRGEIVALKVLYKTSSDSVVSPSCPCLSISLIVDVCSNRHSAERHRCGQCSSTSSSCHSWESTNNKRKRSLSRLIWRMAHWPNGGATQNGLLPKYGNMYGFLFFWSLLMLTPDEDTGSRPRHGIHSLRRHYSR